jgi:uncharacterized protein DUF3471
MKKFIFSMIAVIYFTFLHGQDSTLNEYVGTYKFPEGSVVLSVDIKLENGALMASSTAGSSALEKISKDTFNLVSYSGTVFFTRDADKKVNGIKIEVQDTVLEGKKESAGLVATDFVKERCMGNNLIGLYLNRRKIREARSI